MAGLAARSASGTLTTTMPWSERVLAAGAIRVISRRIATLPGSTMPIAVLPAPSWG